MSGQFSSNVDTLIADFASELAKEATISSGNFTQDYEKLTSSFGIIPCPFVKMSEDSTCCKVLNCEIDLSNWRAMLLAVGSVNSAIKEIVIHGCALTLQHIQDLEMTLEKVGTIHTLKMDFTTILAAKSSIDIEGEGKGEEEGVEEVDARVRVNPRPDASEFWTPVLSGSIMVPYLSLRGCRIDDECIKKLSGVIAENITLRALNLSNNPLSDEGAAELLKILPLMNSIEHLVMKQCQISGESIPSLAQVLTGRAVSDEDDSVLKEVVKKVAEKNKSLKDLNKKRKGKFPEIAELHAASERSINIGDSKLLVHRSLAVIDLSYCPFITDRGRLQVLVNELAEKVPMIADAGVTACGTEIRLLGNGEIDGFSPVLAEYEAGEQINGKIVLKLPVKIDSAELEHVNTAGD